MGRPSFPIPFVEGPSALRGEANLCSKVRRRIFLRNSLLRLARHAICSINWCASAAIGGWSVLLTCHSPTQQRTELQSLAVAVLRCSRNAEPPARQPPREALCELLKVDNFESDLDHPHVVAFSWGKLKLLCEDWQVRPQKIREVALPHVSQHFQRVGEFRLSAEEADHVGGTGAITP